LPNHCLTSLSFSAFSTFSTDGDVLMDETPIIQGENDGDLLMDETPIIQGENSGDVLMEGKG
jgi:hypothetical protein